MTLTLDWLGLSESAHIRTDNHASSRPSWCSLTVMYHKWTFVMQTLTKTYETTLVEMIYERWSWQQVAWFELIFRSSLSHTGELTATPCKKGQGSHVDRLLVRWSRWEWGLNGLNPWYCRRLVPGCRTDSWCTITKGPMAELKQATWKKAEKEREREVRLTGIHWRQKRWGFHRHEWQVGERDKNVRKRKKNGENTLGSNLICLPRQTRR